MSNIRRIAILCLLFVSFAMLGGVAAASRAAAAEVLGTGEEPIRLEASKGTLIRLDRAASTVFVADPDMADVQVKSPRLVYLMAKKPGETVIYAVDREERVLLNRRIAINHNLSRLRVALKRMLPGSTVTVETLDKTLVLSGEVLSARDADSAHRLAMRVVKDEKDIVNKISVVAPNQVHLRVRVAEVSRDILKQFGINWDAVFRTGNFLFGFATGNPVLAGANLLTRNNGTNSIVGSFSNGTIDLNGVIDALDNEGLITILAEPNLTAVSGESATFLAGGEFPILVPENDRITVEFKQFGVSLAFTPVLVTTRRAETTVELGSGQSFAIAGLLQNNITRDVNKLPGLGELPVLGGLFRSDRFQRNETELVIIVTPYIVRPVASKRLSSPTDGLKAPNDTDRIWRGKTHKSGLQHSRQPVHGRGAPNGLAGPSGFVVD